MARLGHRYKKPPDFEYPDLEEMRQSYYMEMLLIPDNKRSRCICRVRHPVNRELHRPLMERYAATDGGRWVAIYDFCYRCSRRKLYPLVQTNEIFMWSAEVKRSRNPNPL